MPRATMAVGLSNKAEGFMKSTFQKVVEKEKNRNSMSLGTKKSFLEGIDKDVKTTKKKFKEDLIVRRHKLIHHRPTR